MTTATTSPIDPAVLDLDIVFDVLSDPRRRYVIYALSTHAEWTLDDLATKLAAWESDVDESAVDDAHRDYVYNSLYHSHVPKLVSMNVLDYEADAGIVRAGVHADQVLSALAGAGSSVDVAQEAHANEPFTADDYLSEEGRTD